MDLIKYFSFLGIYLWKFYILNSLIDEHLYILQCLSTVY